MTLATGASARDTYQAGHHAAVLLDAADRRCLTLAGNARTSFLHRVTTADIKALAPGQARPTLLVTGKGRVVERFQVLCSAQALHIIGSAGTGPEAVDMLRRYVVFEDVEVREDADFRCLLELHGPAAADVLAAAGLAPPPSLPPGSLFCHGPVTWQDHGLTLVQLPGLAATGGWLILGADACGEGLRRQLLAAGESRGLVVADAQGWETLRVEAGLPQSGRELCPEWNPLELRQEDALAFDKGCYVGQEVIARLRTYDRVKRRLWRVTLAGATRPDDAAVHTASGDGVFTSIAPVPGEDRCVALAMLPGDQVKAGDAIAVTTAGPRRQGHVLGPPPTAADLRVAPPAALNRGRFRN